MIDSCRLVSGYGAELPALKNEIKFSHGVNVLFGPNGCGKTTALKVLAGHTFVPKGGGWSGYFRSYDFRNIEPNEDTNEAYKKICAEMSPGRCLADVIWDGSVSYLYSIENSTDAYLAMNGMGDGLMSDFDLVSERFKGSSSGQQGMTRLNKFAEQLVTHGFPDMIEAFREWEEYDHGHPWREGFEKYKNLVLWKRSTYDGDELMPTIMLDEPDRSMGIDAQHFIWTSWIPSLTHFAQVIVASHSPFSLFGNVNVIDMSNDDYARRMKKLVNEMVKR